MYIYIYTLNTLNHKFPSSFNRNLLTSEVSGTLANDLGYIDLTARLG